MPTYAYACTECEHRFDIVQSFSDDALTECPECGGRLRKLFNAVGVVFKGGGFYRTDSRSADTARSGSGSSSGSGSGSTSTDSSSSSSSTSSTGSGSSTAGSGSSGTSSTAKVASGASSTKA